jgi:hypothetical protein
VAGRCYRYIGKADLQMTTSEFDECLRVISAYGEDLRGR